MITYIERLDIGNKFFTNQWSIKYVAVQLDRKGQPLMKITFKGKGNIFTQESANYLKDKMRSRSL